MKYDRKLHSLKHLVKNLLGRVEMKMSGPGLSPGELVVLNYHGTQEKFIGNFEKQVDFFSTNFDVISPADLPAYFNDKRQAERPKLLFTFDDGIRNNRHAARVLGEKNIKALFFIIPRFINTPEEEQKTFFLQNIRPVINPLIDHAPEDFMALSWEELRELIANGHAVGSHTLTHTLLAGDPATKVIAEIAGSKKTILENLSCSTDFFCSPNNSLESIGKDELKLVRENYRFHFSTLPGSNISASPFFIRRINIEGHWLNGAVYRAIGKWDRKRWIKRTERFNAVVTGE